MTRVHRSRCHSTPGERTIKDDEKTIKDESTIKDDERMIKDDDERTIKDDESTIREENQEHMREIKIKSQPGLNFRRSFANSKQRESASGVNSGFSDHT